MTTGADADNKSNIEQLAAGDESVPGLSFGFVRFVANASPAAGAATPAQPMGCVGCSR